MKILLDFTPFFAYFEVAGWKYGWKNSFINPLNT